MPRRGGRHAVLIRIALPGVQAAVYGALCGHVAQVLPVCRGWEDTAWAFLRCWLEVATDDVLGVPHTLLEAPLHTPYLVHRQGGL